MKINQLTLIALCGLISSCVGIKGGDLKNNTPPHLMPESALDPPGAETARKAERLKRFKKGLYTGGEKVTINEGKAFIFISNPDYDEMLKGQLVKAENAEIIACEGIYYFIETNKGERGYMRESDFTPPLPEGFIDPNLFNADGSLIIPDVENSLIGSSVDTSELFPGMELDEDSSASLDKNGRMVTLVSKSSKNNQEFTETKNAIEKKEARKAQAAVTPKASRNLAPFAVDDMDIPDLPESASGQ